MKRQLWVGIAVLVLAALACGSGTSGSAVGSGESCNRSGNTGTCTGTFSKVSGTYTKQVKVDRLHVNDKVQVQITASVESGTLRVTVPVEGNLTTGAEATPGNPISFSATTPGGNGQFPVTFEAVGGDVRGISYTITYQAP